MKLQLKYILLILPFFIWSCASGTGKAVDPNATVHKVKIFGFKFIPATLRIKSGDVVKWVNNDYQPHQVVDQSTGEIQSQMMRQGQSYSNQITQSVDYICLNHPEMKAKIVVE